MGFRTLPPGACAHLFTTKTRKNGFIKKAQGSFPCCDVYIAPCWHHSLAELRMMHLVGIASECLRQFSTKMWHPHRKRLGRTLAPWPGPLGDKPLQQNTNSDEEGHLMVGGVVCIPLLEEGSLKHRTGTETHLFPPFHPLSIGMQWPGWASATVTEFSITFCSGTQANTRRRDSVPGSMVDVVALWHQGTRRQNNFFGVGALKSPEKGVSDFRTRFTNCHLHVLGIFCNVRQDRWQERKHAHCYCLAFPGMRMVENTGGVAQLRLGRLKVAHPAGHHPLQGCHSGQRPHR